MKITTKGKLVERQIFIHTCIEEHLQQDVQKLRKLPVLMKILGHKDIKVTMEYYIDVDVEFQKSENETVINYLMDKDIFPELILIKKSNCLKHKRKLMKI